VTVARRRLTRFMATAALGLGAVLAGPSPAAADPAGPTDYRTEVIEIIPPAAAVAVEIAGGDSFVGLHVNEGTTVEVVGYRGEPYLRFGPDGTVERNDRSPSRWLNEDRYGDGVLPETVDPDIEPEWVTVADDGTFFWHDHRAHWMNPSQPLGASSGDVVLEAVVPLIVDGQDVDVHVSSVLLAPPSIVPVVIGVAAAAVLVLGAVLVGAGPGLMALVAAWAGLAMAVGLMAFRSMPAATGPSLLLWAPAGVAVAAAAGALFAHLRLRSASLAGALMAMAGGELVWWAWLRRDALDHAFIPTDVPFWLDRLLVAGAFVVGAAIVVSALWGVIRAAGPPRRSPEAS